MASKLVVIAFDGAGTADGVLDNIKELEEKGSIQLEDVVIARRTAPGQTMHTQIGEYGTQGAPVAGSGGEVEIEQTDARRGRYAAAGGGIGLLAGMLIGGPIGGLAVGALVGGLHDRGLEDKFVKDLAARLQPDTSAIFLLVKSADADKVIAELRPFKGTVIHTNLPPETEKALRDSLKPGN